MTNQFQLDGSRGGITVHQWTGPTPRYQVLLAHGYGEHAGRYDELANRLVGDGAVVIAPDHQGHGLSDGERALVEDAELLVDDFAAVADKVRTDLPVVVIGHSMGGIIATRYVQRHADRVAALVLSGPVVGGNPAFSMLLGMDPIPEIPIDPAALSRDPAVGEAYAADPLVYHGPFKRQTLESMLGEVDTIAAGPTFGAVPTLWLHGELDQLAPLDVTRLAVERLQGKLFEQKVYPGAHHEIFNETNRDEVFDDVIEFINSVV